jgi:hypothetical protein
LRYQTGLPLLVLLLASPLAAQSDPTAPLVRAGLLGADGDPTRLSYLPLDTGLLANQLCSGTPPASWGTITPRGECDLSVGPPRLGFFTTDSASVSGLAGSLHTSLQIVSSGTWTATAPLSTQCGLWDISMALDPGKKQPVSDLALQTSPADPAQGAFAGVAQLAVRFHFVNRDDGTTLELPATIPLELSGHWTAVSGNEASPDASNLLLYAGTVDGEVSPFPSCGTWGSTGCHVCLTTGLEDLAGLAPGSNP